MMSYVRIFKIAGAYKRQLVSSILCAIITNITLVLLPLILANIIDIIILGGESGELFKECGKYVAVFMLYILTDVFYTVNWQHLHNYFINKDIKGKIIDKILKLPYIEFIKRQTGDWFTVATNDADELLYIIQYNVFQYISNILLLVVSIIFVARLSIILGVSIIVLIIIPSLFLHFNSSDFKKAGEDLRQSLASVNSKSIEITEKVIPIKRTGHKSYIFRDYFMTMKQYIYDKVRVTELETKNSFILEFTELCIKLCIYVISANLIFSNVISVGVFIALCTYLERIQTSWSFLVNNYFGLKKRLISVKNIATLFTSESPRGDKIDYTSFEEPEIKIENLSYSIYDREILHNVNMQLTKGFTSLIGISGSGKTTLTNILLKHLEEYTGNIFVNGINLRDISIEQIRRTISVIPQTCQLFEDTVRFNITLGEVVDDEKLMELCQVVGFDGVKEYPEKLDKIIDGSNSLSAGETQKILLMRVMCRDSSILILDEALSAMDKDSDDSILDFLDNIKTEKLIFCITHDNNPLNKSDRVYELHEKKCRQLG